MEQPHELTVEVFSDTTTAWIIRTPGRRFPAVVIQGDSLSILCDLAEKIVREASPLTNNTELQDAAVELRDSLVDRLQSYESALIARGMQLPYTRRLGNG